jgi:hypothetical protein
MFVIAASQALVIVELGLVLAALGGALAWLGRRAKAMDPGVMRTIRLSPQHMVYVVVIEDRRLLLGAGPGSAPQLICDLTDKPKPAGWAEPTRPAANGGVRPRGGWEHDG